MPRIVIHLGNRLLLGKQGTPILVMVIILDFWFGKKEIVVFFKIKGEMKYEALSYI